MRILNYKDGFIVNGLSTSTKTCVRENTKRGKIKGFSGKSSRRLRDFLVKYTVPGKRRVAITCTLPLNIGVLDWHALVKRFRQNIIRASLAAVWRVELQRRGVPHLHMVGYANGIDDVGLYWLCWVRACDSLLEPSGLPLVLHDGFLVYGFHARWVDGACWIAYLAAHCVKHKNDQLGWLGRQWGVFNRDKFVDVCPGDYQLSDWVSVRIARIIRRKYHYKAFSDNSFGSRVFFGLQRLPDLVDYYRRMEYSIELL